MKDYVCRPLRSAARAPEFRCEGSANPRHSLAHARTKPPCARTRTLSRGGALPAVSRGNRIGARSGGGGGWVEGRREGEGGNQSL